jgi:hypothetical protein
MNDSNFLYNMGRAVNMPISPAPGWMNAVDPTRGDTGGLAYRPGGRIDRSADRVAWQLQAPYMKKVVPFTPAKTVFDSEAKILSASITNGGLRIENNYVLPQPCAGVGGSNDVQDTYVAPNALDLYNFRWSPGTQTARLGQYVANDK